VAVGGGSGLPAVLRGLADLFAGGGSGSSRDHLTAIVTVTDDGGSSGRLRRDLGILPPGDVRNCLEALAPHGSLLGAALQHRFSGGESLDGHSVGNLLLAALTEMTGSFQTAVEQLAELLHLRGHVLPSTPENIRLRAQFSDGATIEGETAIVSQRKRIKRLSLERPVRPLPEALRALVNADVVVVGPGSLYTSVLPNLLVDGIASTLSGLNATRIYIANLMTEPGETDGFTLEDHLDVIRDHVGFDLFDYVLVNRRPVSPDVAERYARQGSHPVERRHTSAHTDAPDSGHGGRCRPRLIEGDLAWDEARGKIRHAPEQLAQAIVALERAGRSEGSCHSPGGVEVE
jgi:uncharacterized cofD-like protein